MEVQNLTCPEILSEDAFREILKNRCIDLPNFKSMNRTELLEIFNRIAMPMSQRIYNQDRPLGKKMHHLRLARNVAVAKCDETSSTKVDRTDRKFSTAIDKDRKKKLKSPVNDTRVMEKKMRLSEEDFHVNNSHDSKRKFQMSQQPDQSKRQKITWP